MTSILRFAFTRTRAFRAFAALALLAAGAGPAAADIAYGITTGHLVFTFDTSAPNIEISHRAVNLQKLQPGESELAMDLRPATGQIYVLGSSSRIYVFDPSTGTPRALSAAPFTPALSGTNFALDVDPTTDTIRVLSDTGQNLRLDPETGLVIAVDTPLNPGTPRVAGAAYANNHAGSTSTALYVIDATTDQLLVSNAPNGGTLTPIGPLGVDTTGDVGFDITANDGVGFATLTTGGLSRLYTINLATGAATLVQTVFSGNIRSFTVLKRGVPMLSLRNGTELIRFHSANPAALLGTVAITGLQGGETLVGIDRRPSNGQVYAVGSTSRLYRLNVITGVATAVGGPFTPALSGVRFGIDFDPVNDRLRLVSDAEQNLTLDADTGEVVTPTEPALTPAGTIVAAAYTANNDGVQFTTQFDIDAASDQLKRQDLPDDGVLTVVGPLGVDAGFDISPYDDAGFAALSVGGVSGLYSIDLLTGRARLIGPIGTGAIVNGLVALPQAYQLAEGSTGTFFDTDILLANPTLAPVPVTVTYQTELAEVKAQSLTLAPQSRVTISADAHPTLGATAFSSTVTSHLGIPIAVERTMRWDSTGYGMHTEKASSALARRWYFAEGSQGFYDTFFLLTNPTTVPSAVQLRFLLENGTEVIRDELLLGESRLTIYAGDIPELVNQAFGTVVTFSTAGGAERAMYFGTPIFNGGHESAGATELAKEWFLAEGATGTFFTTFVLLANPNATPAHVTMTYLREGGGTVTRQKTIPPNTRLTLNVALEDPSLAATSVATRVTSDVGIVVERAMYWPFDPFQWQEAHNAFGVTSTGRHWGLAEGRTGGPFSFQTFVLLANPDSTAANVTATFLRTAGAPVVKTFTVQPGARLTVTTGPGNMVPELANESFGVMLSSDRPIFVEHAIYSNANGIVFAAGGAATASELP
jgi:Domain of unknown function (DUF4394)